MSMIAVTVAELKAGDQVQFPDGKGGTIMAPVLRVMKHRAGLEVLFGLEDMEKSEYRIFGESIPCMRALRKSEEWGSA
jgi:hypothetical protein